MARLDAVIEALAEAGRFAEAEGDAREQAGLPEYVAEARRIERLCGEALAVLRNSPESNRVEG